MWDFVFKPYCLNTMIRLSSWLIRAQQPCLLNKYLLTTYCVLDIQRWINKHHGYYIYGNHVYLCFLLLFITKVTRQRHILKSHSEVSCKDEPVATSLYTKNIYFCKRCWGFCVTFIYRVPSEDWNQTRQRRMIHI